MTLSTKQRHERNNGKYSSSTLYAAFLTLTILVGFSSLFITIRSTTNNNSITTKQAHQERMAEFTKQKQHQQQQQQQQQIATPEKIFHNNITLKGEMNENTNEDSIHYHVIFSTSCSEQQDWESYVFFYHAWKVQQPGTITRIVSGCKTDKETQKLQQFHDQQIRHAMSDKFLLHFTPDFSKAHMDDTTGQHGGMGYKYNNKPFGVLHWFENALKIKNDTNDKMMDKYENDIVMLLDPDMILLKPLVHDFRNDQSVLFVESSKEPLITKFVTHGKPMAQQDGYLHNAWMDLNFTFITKLDNPKQGFKRNDGDYRYNAGPPYLATVRDMYRIVLKWTDYVPRVYQEWPHLFAEMFGYIIAATQLDLPHAMVRSLTVSTTQSKGREGWPLIDAVQPENICQDVSIITKDKPLPYIMHYCKRYFLDVWFFSKYRLKKKYISCETPLLTMPPLDLATQGYNYWLQPPPHGYHNDGKKEPWVPTNSTLNNPRQPKREAFMLCHMIQAVNEAAKFYKGTACQDNPNTNWNETYNFHDDPNH